MRITETWDYRLGHRILEDTNDLKYLLDALENIRIPICPGFKRPPFDVKQGLLNSMIDTSFEKLGWETQPYIDTRKNRESSQKGDFAKTTPCGLNVLVEVEFGNVASTFRDLYKFNLAYSLDSYDCAIFILPEKALAKRIDTIQHFEGAKKLIKDAREFMNMPILLIGVGFDGNEINLLDIVDDVQYWKTYKIEDFTKIIQEHTELFNDRDLH
jgi:hypothetical protein